MEFARLNPYELLVATEKAIGDASLHDTHMALIERRNSMKKREKVWYECVCGGAKVRTSIT